MNEPARFPLVSRLSVRERFVHHLVQLLLHIFFRRVEVVGGQRMSWDRPLVVVANHVNGLVDPLLLLGSLPVVPRFLGKHTLFRNPLIAPLLYLGGVLPVYRPKESQDAGASNAETFARCAEFLAEGGSIALFPEGTSHSEPSLVPMRTGAARIVLEAATRSPDLGVRILPVGLTFDAKGSFRSRALLQIGEPIDPAPEIAAAAGDPVAAGRTLTDRIDAALKAVTLNYGSWEEARLIGRAAEIFARRSADLPGEARLARRFELHRAFIEGYSELARREPKRTAAAAVAVGAYDQLLTASGLRDDQVVADYAAPGVARYLGRTVFRLVIHLPFAIVGTLLNWPTYRLLGTLAARLTHEADLPATYKLIGGLVLFPLTWLGEAALAFWAMRHGLGSNAATAAWVAVATALVAPLTAYAALRFEDEWARLTRESRAFLVLRGRGGLAAELRARRQEAGLQVEALAQSVASRPVEAGR